MTHRNNLGAHTIAILIAVEKSGPSTARQATDATGLEYETVRQYLRRCAFRGLLTVDHVGRLPVYTVSPTWRERLQPKTRPVKERPAPQTTVAKAIARAPALHTIWMNEGTTCSHQ